MKIYKISGYISGWILPNGEIIDLPMYDHADYVRCNASSDKMMKREARGVKTGWILSNGEIIEFSEYIEHWEYIEKNPLKFNIDLKEIGVINNTDDLEVLYKKAYESGAIRFASSLDGVLNIECTRDGLSNNIEVVHRLYKRLGGDNGFYINMGDINTRVDDISELYSYASNKYKIMRVASGIKVGWISPNGEICEIVDSKAHWNYLVNNPNKFGIEMDKDWKEKGVDSLYWQAFNNGAIRYYSSADRILNIECTRNGLRNRASDIHRLYKRLGCNNGLYISIISDYFDENGEEMRIDDISELYSYASGISGVKIYRISMEMRELENKPTTGDGQVELTHLINLLHEIEYKNKMLQGSDNFIHPKRKANIELRLKQYAWVYFEYIRKFTIECFNLWNNLHPIESADKWADMVINSFRERYGKDEDVINHFKDNKLEWGGIEYDITEAPIDREGVREYLQYYSSDDGENLLEDIRGYLESIGGDVDSANLDMIEDDEFIDYYIENMSVDIYSSFIDMNSIRGLIKDKVYRDYMFTWGGTVEDIKDNIKEAIGRMEGIGENSSISEMTMAISLALNVQHASGTILIDMGDMAYDQYIIGDVNSKYLDLLSELDVSDWEREFHKEFAI